jgi:DNA-binding IclR family transcriptional regulator
MTDSYRQAVKSANRVLDLFELLGRWGQEMSHSEIANALSIPKSSLSQLLPNLVDRGYIEFVPLSKGYRLGPKLTALVREVSQSKNLSELVLPILEEITAQTGESSAFNVLNGDSSEVVASVNSPQRLVSHMRSGELAPLYGTSGGKAILAFLSDAMIEDYLKRVKFKHITKNTISSVAELRRQIATIRREKIAHAFEEFTPGIVGIAVPILSETEQVLGSINVAMPAVRYNSKVRDHVVEVLERTNKLVRQQLGMGERPRQKSRRKIV